MNTLPPEERERLRALYEKATPGEWRLCDPQEHPWRVGPIEPQRQDTVTIVNDSGYGIMCFPTEIGSGHTRDFELLIALHNAFPSILHTLEMVDGLREDAEELRKIKDYLWPNQTGMPNEHRNAHIAIEARHRLMMTAKEKAEQERDSLRAELAASREVARAMQEANKALIDELEFIKAHSAIPAPDCNYLTQAGMTCLKCGKVHSGTRLALALSRPGTVEEDGWLPIATAPKDGTDFWACRPWGEGWTYFECRYVVTTAGPRWHDLSSNDWSEPTHWMPLPKAPARKQEVVK